MLFLLYTQDELCLGDIYYASFFYKLVWTSAPKIRLCCKDGLAPLRAHLLFHLGQFGMSQS